MCATLLVDCPGHASLIKTVLGGASIIDCMILVVDVNKGIQTQTAECVVVGEIAVKKLIVCLNKIDSIQDEEKRKTKVEQVEKKYEWRCRNQNWRSLDFVATKALEEWGEERSGCWVERDRGETYWIRKVGRYFSGTNTEAEVRGGKGCVVVVVKISFRRGSLFHV